MLLIAPLLIYGAVFFLLPLALMMHRAVANPEIVEALPQSSRLLREWDIDATPLPPQQTRAILAHELAAVNGKRELGELARRINYEAAGLRALMLSTSRRLSGSSDATTADSLQFDPRWSDRETWLALRRAATPYTLAYVLAAVDLKQNDHGGIETTPADQRIYLSILGRTLGIAAAVTACCILLGYPIATLMVRTSRRMGFVLLLAVMLPFWTSLLARTTAWIVVLQENGLVNAVLTSLRIVDEPLVLIFNSTGLYIVMVHILLPFTVLPIYSTLKGIPPHLMRASASLGAHPLRGFWTVYLPLSMPGIAAGGLLTFIVAAGYYITPSLVGSAKEQMLGYFIAFYANTTVNWGMASALGLVLLGCVTALYFIAATTLGVRQLAGIR